MNPLYLKQYKDTPYYLNQDGEVYRKFKNGYRKMRGGEEYKAGNKRIRINIGSRKVTLSRMMWETFHGEIPEGYCIAHANGCTLMNELGNLRLISISKQNSYKTRFRNVHKIIDLSTGRIYKGTRKAAKGLKHSRYAIVSACNGIKLPRTKIKVAWWDDVNGKAFKGNYDKYYQKHMQEEW